MIELPLEVSIEDLASAIVHGSLYGVQQNGYNNILKLIKNIAVEIADSEFDEQLRSLAEQLLIEE